MSNQINLIKVENVLSHIGVESKKEAQELVECFDQSGWSWANGEDVSPLEKEAIVAMAEGFGLIEIESDDEDLFNEAVSNGFIEEKRQFAVVMTAAKAPVIFGVGETREAAINDAAEWMDTNGIEENRDFEIAKCTPRLAEYVRSNGGQGDFVENNGVYDLA